MLNALIIFAITTVVTAITLILITKIPDIGIEIDGIQKAIISAIVFGIINGITQFLFGWLKNGILTILTLGISGIIGFFLVNFLAFGLTAKLIHGFRIKSWISCALGAIAMTFINSFLQELVFKALPIQF
jgi:putative membrane protein